MIGAPATQPISASTLNFFERKLHLYVLMIIVSIRFIIFVAAYNITLEWLLIFLGLGPVTAPVVKHSLLDLMSCDVNTEIVS